MRARFSSIGLVSKLGIAFIFLFSVAATSFSQNAAATEPAYYGPYNAIFLPDGDGLRKPLAKDDPVLRADSPWSIYAWVKPAESSTTATVLAGVGDAADEFFRALSLDNGRVLLSIGKDNSLSASASFAPGSWHFLAATFDGETFALFSDGVKVASGKLDIGSVSPFLEIAPPAPASTNWKHFGGMIASLTLLRKALTPDEIKQLSMPPGDFANMQDPPCRHRPRHRAHHPWSTTASIPIPTTASTTSPSPSRSTSRTTGTATSSPTCPPRSIAQQLTLTFEGINYRASIWLNGQPSATITGAFRRGSLRRHLSLSPAKNVLAVRISPPPHPGIPQEQSILGGPGENGGAMALDGPTFVATEGWDWIPAIRDRDSGIWQPVILRVTHRLKLGDAQVVTTFPQSRHRNRQASTSPSRSPTSPPRHINATLNATIEHHRRTKPSPCLPARARQTHARRVPPTLLQHPRLWWPNGYGKPELYHLSSPHRRPTRLRRERRPLRRPRRSPTSSACFDSTGHLRRVEYTPANRDVKIHPIVDVSHDGMREIPRPKPFPAATSPGVPRDRLHLHVASLTPGAETLPAIQPLTDLRAAPYLVLKVNGVRIAARGGNWGMDDSRKRVSREHLEPYFRLNRDANLNIIRNWVGQSTEETFYELADEYGMMVWNDFWESTENYNIEAEDPAALPRQRRDTIKRFRNHPSIVVWCGRNEGVPQPIINLGLDALVRTLDGTRYYSPSSNASQPAGQRPVPLSGPPLYYTTLNRGFSVETGTPSMSTLESFQSTTPKEDQWPIDDVWAYHDWHQSGNGDVAPFMAEMQAEFGAPTSLEDFERKAQMLNYVDHRAIFEGMNANLWTPNSGRLLWMTQPAWPSTMWQILSSDYDTQASFYGVKEGLRAAACAAQPRQATASTSSTPPPQPLLAGHASTEARFSLCSSVPPVLNSFDLHKPPAIPNLPCRLFQKIVDVLMPLRLHLGLRFNSVRNLNRRS
jgi:hypothetical protein